MDERVTLKDIARTLGVSIGTVERAIHGKRDINPDTKRLVLEKIEELNYKPNKFARSLSVKNRKEIAVIMPYNSYFWYRMKNGIERAQRETAFYGIHVEYMCAGRIDSHIVLSYVRECVRKGVDGIILVPVGIGNTGRELMECLDGETRVVMLNDDVQGLQRLFYVGPDNNLIGRLAGELTGKFAVGRGKCLLISGINAGTGEMPMECTQRIAAFRSVIESDFPGIKTEMVLYTLYMDSAYNILKRKLAEDPGNNVIYSVDGFLCEAAMAVRESGRKGITLVGHEMSNEVNRYLAEGVISAAICQNPFLQGYYALKYMADYLMDKKMPPYDKMFIHFDVYTRFNAFGRTDYADDIGGQAD